MSKLKLNQKCLFKFALSQPVAYGLATKNLVPYYEHIYSQNRINLDTNIYYEVILKEKMKDEHGGYFVHEANGQFSLCAYAHELTRKLNYNKYWAKLNE